MQGFIDQSIEKINQNDPNFKYANLTCKFMGDELREQQIEDLGNALEKNSCLESLDLTYNKIGNAGVKVLAPAVENNSSLKALNLTSNKIGDEGIEYFVSVLEKSKSLASLDLTNNKIGVKGMEFLAKGLLLNKKLAFIDLSENKLVSEGIKFLAIVLENNTCLKSLRLYSNYIDKEGAKALGNTLEKNTSLSSLELQSNKIGDSGTEFLSKSLETNIFLKKLKLGSNLIRAVGGKNLAMALKKNSSLESLELGSNQIADTGANELANAMEENNSLILLDLNNNNIGAAGAKNLALALEKNTGLKSLDLNGNKIEAIGAESLANMLEKNNCLSSLSIGGGVIGDEGTKHISSALIKNSCLRYLDLKGNIINEIGLNHLINALSKNTTLNFLDLSYNPCVESQKNMEVLTNCLAGNYTLLELKGVSFSGYAHQISLYLKRNQQIADCLKPLNEGIKQGFLTIDGKEIESLLNKVKEIIPEFDSLAEDSYPVEAYRLLTALGHASTLDKKAKIAAIHCLLPSFRHQAFNNLAEKTLGQLLISEFNQPLWGLYYLRNHLQNPEIKNFALIALFKLNNPDELFDYKTKQNLEKIKILSGDEFQNLLSKALDSLKGEPNSSEAILLKALMDQKNHAFSVPTACFSKVFHEAFKAQYPNVKFFTTIEHCLRANSRKGNYIMDLSITPKEAINEKQLKEFNLQLSQDKQEDLATIVEGLEQNFENICVSEMDKLEDETLITKKSSVVQSNTLVASNSLIFFQNSKEEKEPNSSKDFTL